MQRLLAPTQQRSLKKRIFWRSFILLTLLIASVALTAIVSDNNHEQILVMSLLALLVGAGLCRQTASITTTEVEQATETLLHERVFLQTVIDGVVDPLRVIDNNKQIIMMNRSAKNKLTDSRQQGVTCFDNYCGELDDQPCPLAAVRDSNGPMRIIQHRQHKDGSINICEIEASPLIAKGKFIGIVETTRDITDRIKLEANLDEKESRLIYLSRHDQLTNLPNRIQFRDRLTMTLAGTNDPDKVALLFIGLDRFKKINEALGREVGDQALMQVAQRLKRCLGNDELIARLGSDEFAVIIEDGNELRATAIRMSKQILEQVIKPLKINGHEIYLTTSIGISLYPDDGNDTKQLLTNADIALTCAKTAGKNRYQFFEATMIRQTNKFFKLENDLRKALEKEQLEVYYQPQINLDTQQITGLEALIRWNHPQHGLVSPLDFIPLAEENGLIFPIGEWVLRRACEQLIRWQDQGFSPLTVAVNLSPVQFRQANLVKTVARIIAETGISPDSLELEITESMIMDGLDRATSTMLELTELGVNLAIDDFGTGYSSLSYLRYFPLSKLKIDKCFVERITTDEHDAALASSVIALAHSLNLKVVAEGIETEEQAKFLREKNCHQGQGFLYSKPLPADQLITLITNNRKNRSPS